jgi:hypothetical protein
MRNIIFTISKNFVLNKFVRWKFKYIRLRTCFVNVGRRGCSHATKNNYISFVGLVRLVQISEALRGARSYKICQQQNSILELRALVSLKRNLFDSAKAHFYFPLSAHFCSSLEYLVPANCRLLAQKLVYWTRNSARSYRSAVVEIIMNSESSKTMLLHVLRLVLNRARSYQIE